MEGSDDDVQYIHTFKRSRFCTTKSSDDQKHSSSSKVDFDTPNWKASSKTRFSESVSPLTKPAIDPFQEKKSGGGHRSQSNSLKNRTDKSPSDRKRSRSTISSASPTKRLRTDVSRCEVARGRPFIIDLERVQSENYSVSPNESIITENEDVEKYLKEAKDDFIDLYALEDFSTSEQNPVDFSAFGIQNSQTQAKHLVNDDICTDLPYYQYYSMRLSAGQNVELKDGDFLRIERISQKSNGAIVVQGQRFRRTKGFKGILELKRNEVCWIVERVKTEGTKNFVETNQEVDVGDIKWLRDLRLTNLPYPEASYRGENKNYPTEEDLLRHAPLVCRWKMVVTPMVQNERRSSTWEEQILQRLIPDECDSGMTIEQGHLRQEFRGETVIGGSSVKFSAYTNLFGCQNSKLPVRNQRLSSKLAGYGQRPPNKARKNGSSSDDNSEEGFVVVNKMRSLSIYETDRTAFSSSTVLLSSLDGDFEEIRPIPSSARRTQRVSSTSSVQMSSRSSIDRLDKQQKYTFGDAFCGCGGTSRGASMAKLQINWGFDFNVRAIEAYRSNFDQTEGIHQAAHDFLQGCSHELFQDQYKVDILHMSPPCQPFSPAHTVVGKDDERNEASLFAIDGLLEKIRPRVATVEQTFGLLSRHPEWFKSVVLMFTRHNYSVRWKILNCKDFGIPQARRRLVLIGSCPGEALPPFPEPTHGPSSATDSHSRRLRPYTTVGDQIGYIPEDCPAHGPMKYFEKPKTPYDKNTIMSKTITCSGGIGNYHPDGLRAFTPREFACLQTFPLSHTFSHVGTTKQIGNAVPPLLAKTLFKSIVQSLRKADGLE